MNATKLEQLVTDFIDEQGIAVDFPESDLDIKVALVRFSKTVLEDAEKAENMLMSVCYEVLEYPKQPLSSQLQNSIRKFHGHEEVDNATAT